MGLAHLSDTVGDEVEDAGGVGQQYLGSSSVVNLEFQARLYPEHVNAIGAGLSGGQSRQSTD